METLPSYNRNRTLSSILWNKFLDTLSCSSWYDIFTTFAKVFSWLIISILLINIPESKENLTIALKWHDFLIIKVLSSFCLVFFAPFLISGVKKVFSWFSLELQEVLGKIENLKPHGPMYQGIPIIELVDYLFLEKSFARAEFCERFGVSRKVFDDLVGSLDKIRIFVRGANNARTLSEEYSRADITSILTRASESGEIRPLVRETKIGFSHRGSMPDILSRHGFTTYPLHSENV